MNNVSSWYRVGSRISVLIGCLVIVSCLGDRSTGPEQSTQRITPGAKPSATPAIAPCTITATVNSGTLWTSNNYGETKCGVRWNISVPALIPQYNGLYWWGYVSETPTTRTYDRFETCCSGMATRQNGPLLVDFLPAVRSVTVRTWDYNGLPNVPAGLYIAAVNARGDTIARATTDGVTPPTLPGGGPIMAARIPSSAASTSSAAVPDPIARLVIFPKKTGVTYLNGDTEVVHATYQIEYVPAPCPTGDKIGDHPGVRNFLKSQLDLALQNGRLERSGPIYEITAGADTWIEAQYTTQWATQCRNGFTVAKDMVGYKLVGIWHTHAMVPGSNWSNCPTSQGPDFGPGKLPSPEDYEAQELWKVPEYIFDLDDMFRIDPHIGTDPAARRGATSWRNWSKCPDFFS